MFNSDLSLLDYIWRVLAFGTVALSVTYTVGTFLQSKGFRINPTHSKNIWRILHGQIMLVLIIASGYLVFDQQAAINCFENFIKQSSALTITRGLSAAWLFSVSLLIVFDILNTVKSFVVSKTWKQNADSVLHTQVENIAKRIGVKVPRILLQNKNQSPFVFGLIQMSMVFPEEFSDAINPDTLSSVIAHELIHVKDLDTRWNLLEHLTRRLFFFHPLVYVAKNLYTDAQEKSADLQAIHSLQIKKSDFVKSFFEVINFCKEGNSFALSASSTSNFKSLKSRMNYLASSGRESTKSSTILLFAVGFLVSGAWSLVEAKSSLGSSSKNDMGINMCAQVQHEIVLEKLFRMKSVEPVRCE